MNLTHQISPFDSSVNARLQRMGLLQDDSSPHEKAIATFARLHAAIFFDDLCDCMEVEKSVRSLVLTYESYLNAGEYHKLFVLYSWQYDTMHLPFPAAVWWIAGTRSLIALYMKYFVPALAELAATTAFDDSGTEGGDAGYF